MITTKNIREAHPITDLTSPFTLNGYGFRIKVTKKTAEDADTLSITGKLLGSDTAVTTLIKSEQWSDEIYKEISVAVLTNHNLEWGVEFPTSYSVHYDLDGGIFVANGARVATYNNQLTWGQKATEPETDPTLYDHTFKGWYIVTDGVPEETAFDFANTLIYANTTITAVYQENLTVTFNSAGGAAVAPIQVLEGETIEEPTDPTRTGYTFDAWQLDEVDFDFNDPITDDITLVAAWIENFTVTFDSDGGSAEEAQEIVDGSTATEPATDPTKEGYTFVEWTLEGTAYNFATAVTEDITLVATWLEHFTVTFNSDGGSDVTAQEIEDGSTATAPTDPTKSGYTFNEWYNGETLFNFTTPITADITLTAHWLENFTVTFDSQGGTAVTAQEVADGSVATLPDPAPTKDGFTFSHWSDTIDGTEFAFTTPITADITLYAVWTE